MTIKEQPRGRGKTALYRCRGERAARYAIRSLFFSAILMAVIVALCGPAYPSSRQKPASYRMPVLRAQLRNGLRVVIVKDPLAPVVTTELNYLVGSDEAPQGFPGTAHALEHMMFRGSPELSADQLADIVAAMGGNFNADTQQMVTQFFFTIPAGDLNVALHIESIRMKAIRCTKGLWGKERGAIEQEVAQDLSSPEYVFYKTLLSVLFAGTPYAHDALGTRPSFNATPAKMLRNFHKTWYVPNNAILVIVGDIEPRIALGEVRRLFGDIPAGRLPPRPLFDFKNVKPGTIRMATDLPYGLVMIAHRMPGTDSLDYAASQILSDALNNERGNLYALVVKGKALFTGFEYDPLPRSGLGFAFAAFPRGNAPEKLAGELRNILNGEIKAGIPADLVEAAKKHEITDQQFEGNSVAGLAQAWSQAVAVERRNSPNDDLRMIEKVTAADVDRVAKSYLRPEDAVVGILTPASSGKPIASRGFGGAESFAPKKTRQVAVPRWARSAVERLLVPRSTIKPFVSVLPNGLRLIVQPEPVSNTVTVLGGIINNPLLEQPKGKDGIDRILNQLFQFGTTTLNRVEFLMALDDIGARESAGTVFSLRVLSGNFDTGVRLLADNELHPALPAKAFAIIRRQTAGAVAGEIESPDYLTTRTLQAALYPKDDPVLRQATPRTVDSITLQDVKRYYHDVFRPDMTTIVVIGNVSPEAAKAVIGRYFGGWKATGAKPVTNLPPVPPNKPSIATVPDTSRVQDRVILAETLGLTRLNPDHYPLELGNHILGGAFYATRLYRDLRENNGIVYYIGSSFTFSKTRGTYEVTYGCDPDKVALARTILLRDLKQMKDSEVTAAELKQAKAQEMRSIPLSESSEDSIADGLLARSIEGIPLDEPIRAAHVYLKLSRKEIREAFATWLRLRALVEVTEGPLP